MTHYHFLGAAAASAALVAFLNSPTAQQDVSNYAKDTVKVIMQTVQKDVKSFSNSTLQNYKQQPQANNTSTATNCSSQTTTNSNQTSCSSVATTDK